MTAKRANGFGGKREKTAGAGGSSPRPGGLLLWQLLLLAHAAGIAALCAPWAGAAALASLALLVRLHDPERFRPVALLLAFALGLGHAWVRLPDDPLEDADAIPAFMLEREKVRVEGLAVEVETRPRNVWNVVLGEASCVRADGERTGLPGGLLLTWEHPPAPPAPGMRLTAETRVYPQGGLANFGGWDFARSWALRGVFWRAWARGHEARPEGEPPDGAAARRAALATRLAALAPPDQGGALLRALLTGDRSGLSQQTVERMRASALAHTLALSGLHLAMAAGLGFGLAWLAGRARPEIYLATPLPRLAVLLGAPLALLYLWLGGAGHSLLRAALMFAAFGLALWRGRAGAFLDGLFLALAAILLASPLSLFDLSLQMSVLAVAGIIVLGPYADAVARGLADLVPGGGERRAAKLLVRWPLTLLGVSLAANLALLPLTLRTFGQVPAGLVWNLLWLPLMQFWVMPAGLLALLPAAAGWDGPAACLLGLAALPARFLLACLERADAAGLLAGLSGVRPLWPAMLGYWVLAAWLLMRPARGPRRLPGLVLAFCLLAGPGLLGLWEQSRDRVAVEFLDVGQGQAVLIETPGGRRTLVDAGGVSAAGFDMGRAVVVPRLTLNHAPRLDLLFLSHAENDHAGGAGAVAGALRVGGLVWSGREAEAPAGRAVAERMAAAGVPLRAVRAGERVELGGGAAIEVLHPGPEFVSKKANDLSLVLRLTWRGRGLALLPGDLERPGMRGLFEQARPMAAALLALPHHGSAGSLEPRLYRAVAPDLAVASAGWLNRWDFPACTVRAALDAVGLPLWTTGAYGAVRLEWSSPDARPVVRTALAAPLPLQPCQEDGKTRRDDGRIPDREE